VKTAISIPDETFQEAERHADALGVSRSEFFTIAARHYIDELDAQSLTKRIDTVVDLLGEDDSSLAAVDHGRAMLAADTDEW
jgi:metal-responsive CopG/Arc/MetJ family transcriptional regulator